MHYDYDILLEFQLDTYFKFINNIYLSESLPALLFSADVFTSGGIIFLLIIPYKSLV